MYRLAIKRRLCQTSRYAESDKSQLKPINQSRVSTVYPHVLEKLAEPEKIKTMLGQDMPQRILEDVHYSLQSHEHDELNVHQRELKKRELKLYMQSIARLQSNKYAVEYKR